jgi:hypothetical protein
MSIDTLSLPDHEGYLVPDPRSVQQIQKRYYSTEKPLRVGISWRSTSATAGHRKTTSLISWRDILTIEGVQFVNLQYGDCNQEIAEVHDCLGVDIIDDPNIDPLVNLDAFSAQVATLDLVVSTPNTTVHFAGGLGVPVWTILPVAPEWRWLRRFSAGFLSPLSPYSTPWTL